MNDKTHRNPYHSLFFFRGRPSYFFFSGKHLSLIDSFIFFVFLFSLYRTNQNALERWKFQTNRINTHKIIRISDRGRREYIFLLAFHTKQVIFCLSALERFFFSMSFFQPFLFVWIAFIQTDVLHHT